LNNKLITKTILLYFGKFIQG